MTEKSLQNLSDEELFELVKANNKFAFEVLYPRFSKRLFAYCLKACATREIAEDTFQIVLTNLYEKRESFIGGSFMAWLMTIARNQCLMNHRQKKLVQEEFDFDIILHTNSNEDFLLPELIHKTIDSLPFEYAEIIKLKFFAELENKEICDMLNISDELVRVRLFRAKKMIFEKLKKMKSEII